MVTFPNCKINLGLNILQKRKDGYHDLETVFYPVPLNDILEIVTSEGKTAFRNTGISGGEASDNLCLKAYHLLKKDFQQLPEIKMHLHKAIPVGAGLGGGSADAAFTLMLLNQKYNLNIGIGNLAGYASELGSDCPFFLLNSPCFATGRGEKMEKISLTLSSYKILLIHPGIHISTKELFSKIKPSFPQKSIKEIIQQPIETWKTELKNDFETIVLPEYEEIRQLKESLYQHNALYVSMSGTGSTIYAIFRQKEPLESEIKEHYFFKWLDPQ